MQNSSPIVQYSVVQQEPSSPHLRFYRLHKGFGVIFMLFGCIIIVLEALGYIIRDEYYRSAIGFWTGVLVFVLPGALIYRAGEVHSLPCLKAGFGITIVGYIILIAALSTTSVELGLRSINQEVIESQVKLAIEFNKNKETLSNVIFNRYRCAIDIILCVISFILFPIHNGFACADMCGCCRSKARQTTMTTTVIQGNTGEQHQQRPFHEQGQPTGPPYATPPPVSGPYGIPFSMPVGSYQYPTQYSAPTSSPQYNPNSPQHINPQPTAPPSYDYAVTHPQPR